ncbi:MAG: hypothetical protein JO068_18815 [Hyphomicrobiales bacterium]|nr:hypothetical protein [Hyphomicrobiales bacterium]
MSGETVTQLIPPLDIRTPWGWATCFAWIHSGAENEPQWKCAIYDGERAGHVIDVPQKDVRFGRNYSVSRTETTLPPEPPEMMRMERRATTSPPPLRVKIPAPPPFPKRSARDRMGVGARASS